MSTSEDTTTVQTYLQQIETLIQEIEAAADPAMRARVETLLKTLLELHGAGLERMLGLIWDSGASGQVIIDQHLAQDELVSNLMLLHGLHPLDLEARVRQTLDKLGPYLRSFGSKVELLSISEAGVVNLRLEESCQSCSSARVNLKTVLEEAIFAAAPDVTAVETQGAAESLSAWSANFIALASSHTKLSLALEIVGDGFLAIRSLWNSAPFDRLRMYSGCSVP